MSSNWALFKLLCHIIGGQDSSIVQNALQAEVLSSLRAAANRQDVLPTLALRMDEAAVPENDLTAFDRQVLEQALRENTHRNMQAVMQALKLTRTLNDIGITPTFLKGTAHLLTIGQAQLGYRKQIDIDLVLTPEELTEACKALMDAGYYFWGSAKRPENDIHILRDIEQAFMVSASHHHLPVMINDNYSCSVELHRHFLPKRFQRRNPLGPVLDTTIQHESHGATFRVLAPEYQIIHIILGKFVNDGYRDCLDFPIKDACDFIRVLENSKNELDKALVLEHCGRNFGIFSGLVAELMGYEAGASFHEHDKPGLRLQIMEKRYNSEKVAKLLDIQARARHLGLQLLHSPMKLPAYLRRQLTSLN